MKNVTPLTIRYAETDMMGVVYHANYLLYMEDARTAFLEALGIPYQTMEDAGFMSPVLSLEVNYGSPLRYGDKAVMVTWVSRSTAVKTVYNYAIFREGDDIETSRPLFTGSSTHCVVRRDSFEPVSIKREFPQLFEAYKRVLEE